MIILQALAVLFVFSPFLPTKPNAHWLFRTADFICLQSLVIQAILITAFFTIENQTIFSVLLIAGLFCSPVYQLQKVAPYATYRPKETKV